MKPVAFFITAAVLMAFGLLTLFLTSSIILDLFGIRAHEGNYVLFIVWANLLSGILFITAAAGFMMKKSWAASPLIASLVILAAAFIGLLFHISAGAAYETKTIGAMIFRMAVNAALAWVVYSATKKKSHSTLAGVSVLLIVPLSLLAVGCNHASDKNHDHHAVASEDAHHHGDHTGALSLNNGEKWIADEHTHTLVGQMKSELADFDKATEKDYKVLSDSLTNQLNVLIVGCTMEGPAHDELHKWLVPVTENVKALSVTKEEATVNELKTSLESFDEYFRLE